MTPNSIRRWRSRMARELGLSQPISNLQRHLLTDLLAFRTAAQHGTTQQERDTGRVRYGRCLDRLTSRMVRRTHGPRRPR